MDDKIVLPTDNVPDIGEKWFLPELYRDDKLMWQVGFDGEDSLIMRISNVNTGHVRETKTEVLVNNSGRPINEQAFLEAKHRYLTKYRNDGYRPLGDAPPEDEDPMLAFTWISKVERDKMKASGVKVDSKYKIVKEFPVVMQPKVDGIRCLSKIIGTRVKLRSRGSNEFKYFDSIRNELFELFMFLPGGCEIDGELYVHGMPMNEIASIVKTIKQEHDRIEEIKYFIFDIRTPEPMGFVDRYNMLINAYNQIETNTPHLNILECETAENDEEIENIKSFYVGDGYEGAMIRAPESFYQTQRTADLLKTKIFEDEEGTCIGVEDAKGTEKGAAMLIVRDKHGNEFKVRMKVPMELRREWLKDPSLVVGKQITFTTQGRLKEGGKPRFQIGIAVRDYE
ncbi:MAG: hypothetical protein AAB966_00940 [Patescibacteria group bacterium]